MRRDPTRHHHQHVSGPSSWTVQRPSSRSSSSTSYSRRSRHARHMHERRGEWRRLTAASRHASAVRLCNNSPAGPVALNHTRRHTPLRLRERPITPHTALQHSFTGSVPARFLAFYRSYRYFLPVPVLGASSATRDIDCSRASSPVAVKWRRRPHRPWSVGVSRTWQTNMLAK